MKAIEGGGDIGTTRGLGLKEEGKDVGGEKKRIKSKGKTP